MSKTELFIEAQHRLGESIIWHQTNHCLYWVDLLDAVLYRHDPLTGKTDARPLPLAAPIGAIAATSDPNRLMITHLRGLSLLSLTDLSLEAYCDPEAGRDAVMSNDAKCDRWGRLWLATSHIRENEARGCLWCVKDRKTFALGDAGFAIANGPAVSPDGRTLYFNDSVGRVTYAYDIEEGDLHPRNRRALIHFTAEEGLPDGIITDAEGCLWIAHWGGRAVSRYSPDGLLLSRHPVPAHNVTTMCFAGPSLSTLFITTARDGLDASQLAELPLTGSLFRLETECRGLAEPLFPAV